MESKELATSAFQFSDPRQKRIYEGLRELVGPGPAAFFRDACWLMANPEALHVTAHLVAHLLREIESAFREVLTPVAEDASAISKGDGQHKEQIKQILSAIGLGRTHLQRRHGLSLPISCTVWRIVVALTYHGRRGRYMSYGNEAKP